MNRALSDFRFDEASNAIYQFFWHEFCDWYIEMVKPVLLGRHGTPDDQQRAKRVLLEVLDRSLRLLHPFMPFITEEIWQKLGGVEPSIMVAPYPIGRGDARGSGGGAAGARGSGDDHDRAQRARASAASRRRIASSSTSRADGRDAAFFDAYAYLLIDLARLTEVVVNGEPPAGAHHDVVEGFTIAIEFPEKVVTKEQQERTRARAREEPQGARVARRQAGQRAVREERAAGHRRSGAQARQAELRARIEKLMQNQ